MSEDHPVLFSCTAPAKINLALHIVGQRDDEYHLIDSLVTFARIGTHCGSNLLRASASLFPDLKQKVCQPAKTIW